MIFLLLNFAGVIALLIWSVRLIRTGVERAYGVHLRQLMRRGGERRIPAAATGTIAAFLLQSSTVVALLASGFAASGVLSARAALSVVFGADLGSAAIASVLTARADWVQPVLLVIGVTLFLRSETRIWKQTGRILVGVALVFISLGMIGEATAPLRDSQGIGTVMTYLGRDLVTAFVVGAVLAWAIHSSVAAVLLIVTLSARGMMPPEAGAALVLGANLGGAMIAFGLTLGAERAARRVVLANIGLRGGAALLALLALIQFQPPLGLLGAKVGGQVLILHIGFNFVVVVAGLALLSPLLALTNRVLTNAPNTTLPRETALDEALLATPDRAVTAAQRETLRMGEAVAAMLAPVFQLYSTWDEQEAARIRLREAEVNTMNFEIKLYLAKAQAAGLSEAARIRARDLSALAVSIEAAGDLVEKNLLAMARRMTARGITFSPEGALELSDLHDRVLASVQLALNVIMSGDAESARCLAEEKEHIREIEARLQALHIERLAAGSQASIDTSNIHQETIRVLKQINNSFAIVANPILRETGELLPSRLAGG